MIFGLCLYSWFSFICGPSSGPELLPQPSPENPEFVFFTCQSTSALYHQWYQGYIIGTVLKKISIIPLQAGVKKTHYYITLEKFDYNTGIYCDKEKYKDNLDQPRLKLKDITRIMVPNETMKQTEEPAKLLYSQTKNALFSCENYAKTEQGKYNVHVGVINMTSNTIIAYNQKSIQTRINFNWTHSGITVLCCIYYKVFRNGKETWIYRRVTDKTLLIYEATDMSPKDLSSNFIREEAKTAVRENLSFAPPKLKGSLKANDPSGSANVPRPKATQNITCVHRYQNDNHQIATYEVPIQDIFDKKFTIKVENFDNNTEMYCIKDKNDTPPKVPSEMSVWIGTMITILNLSQSNSTLLKVINETPTKDELISLKYNETKNVTFSCQEHTNKTVYFQLGIINTTSNIIKTIQETKMNQTFNITHNGTILCCIYYKSNETDKKEIIRSVTNKNLLVYAAADGNENGGHEDIPKGTENKTNNANTNLDATVSSDQAKIYKIVSAVALTVFLLLIVIAIWKRRCRKKPISDHKVLYAELDFHRRTEPGPSTRPDVQHRPNPEEESPYAQIIGEMRPQ